MGTTIRPELSPNNQYCIDRDHFYELKHFCKQYNLWVQRMAYIDSGAIPSGWIDNGVPSRSVSNPTEKLAILRTRYFEKISIVDNAISRLEEFYRPYIKDAVTNGLSYEYMREIKHMPFCKNTFYDQYHKFFWILSTLR